VDPDPESHISGPLRADGRILRSVDGQPWRWRGVSAVQLLDRFARGEDISGFLDTFARLCVNPLLGLPYVPWASTGWAPPSPQRTIDFLEVARDTGFYVELTLLTDDDGARIQPAIKLLNILAETRPVNVVIEIGNEPQINKHIDVVALRASCEVS